MSTRNVAANIFETNIKYPHAKLYWQLFYQIIHLVKYKYHNF